MRVIRAHPRVCGENSRWPSGRRAPCGSSPRVRGKLDTVLGLGQESRLIPACAGKTVTFCHLWTPPPAHPRVCGENHRVAPTICSVPGSSPRVRGKPERASPVRNPGRLIPACAGKTRRSYCTDSPAEAHPRVCGENFAPVYTGTPRPGSSPRVRGKQAHEPPHELERRLIPACAGKTRKPAQSPYQTSAHPRVCGENAPGAGLPRW